MKSITSMIDAARSHTANSLPDETHQSYPVPVRGNQGILVAFMYCTSRVVFREGIYLLPPSHLGFMKADDAKFVELRNVRPSDFGQRDPENQFLGKFAVPAGMTQDEFAAIEARLFRSYDVILPAFSANPTNVSPEGRQSVREFKTCFEQITEKILHPYYRSVGRDFFAWLDKVS